MPLSEFTERMLLYPIIWTNKEKETWSKRVSGTPEMRHLQIYGKLGITNPLNDQLLEM